MGGRRRTEARPTGGVVGGVAAVHGLHLLHVHVAHVVERGTVAQQALVDCTTQQQQQHNWSHDNPAVELLFGLSNYLEIEGTAQCLPLVVETNCCRQLLKRA